MTLALDKVAAAAGATGAAPRAHSTIGASSYYRWKRSACPGSVKLSKGMPNRSTKYAAEGSVAHAIGERAILKRIGLAPDDDFDQRHALGCVVKHEEHDITIDDEMLEAAEFYADTVLAEYKPEDGDILYVEKRFNLRRIHPGLFGTSDTVLIKVKLKKIIVFDLKYGAGIAVEAEENEQLQYYCVGALLESNAGVLDAEVVIVQPRAFHEEGPVRRWAFPAVEIFDFVEDLKADAQATEDPNAPLRAGEWCRFCPAAPICKTLKDYVNEMAKQDFGPVPTTAAAAEFRPIYDPAALNEVLRALPTIKSWVERVEAFARAEALTGRGSNGHKLVRGKGSRELKDQKTAVSWLLLGQGVAESAMYHPRELKSVAQLEVLLDKGARKEFQATYVRKVPGGLVLAPLEDKRDAVNPTAQAAQEFGPLAAALNEVSPSTKVFEE